MSIEFGILREGSTITLLGEHRVDVDEELFSELAPLFRRIEQRTGQELDMYGGAVFAGEELRSFVNELMIAIEDPALRAPARVFLSELLRVARFAESTSKSLSYFGL